ncbi:hypothetical protein H206_01803 [Candidatus Electrothrix aarhusensis]|uniref:Uncharacterized protein n=1 Tax=Candidatus Electrothrix aarhusensis TaxID=1859131 RepID=A0A444J1I7_9BACT|nr:hypothetical protein H206_01803 [Candidatus Electrothrix aarhusensis]
MKKYILFVRGISLLMGLVIMLSVTSCGTILYPERRGQTAGYIDAGVAMLDGIGLLFFFVPGVIAFAVDFTTGAIYLPSGSSRLALQPSKLQDARIIQARRHSLTSHDIEAVVEQETGQKIDLVSPQTKVARISSGQNPAWTGIAEALTPDQFAVFKNNRLRTTFDNTL